MQSWNSFADWLGVEFKKPFRCVGTKETYIITDKGVGYHDASRCSGVDYDSILALHLISGKMKPVWRPRENEVFYYPSFMDKGLVGEGRYYGHETCKRIIENVGAYEIKEEAYQKSLSLGWKDFAREDGIE